MRISIDLRERKQSGTFNARTLYDVCCDVQFAQEELALIDKHKLRDHVLVERDFSTVVRPTVDIFTAFWLGVLGLVGVFAIYTAYAMPGATIGVLLIFTPYPLYRAWRAYRLATANRVPEADWLYVRDLIRNHPDVYTCAMPSEAAEYERVLVGSLEILKANLVANVGIEEKHKVYDL